MRKHSVRKWIHALLDMLPLFIIPVFMVYSHRHTIDSYSVTRDETELVSTTYNIVNLMPVDSSSWDMQESGVVEFYPNQGGFSIETTIDETFYINTGYYPVVHDGDVIYLRFIAELDDVTNQNFDFNVFYLSYDDGDAEFFHQSLGSNDYEFRNYYLTTSYTNLDTIYFEFYYDNYDFSYLNFGVSHFELFNLTTIFGAGNEPSEDDFVSILTDSYHTFNVSYPYVVTNEVTQSVTYNNTDIGSQFIYALYNPIHDYMNFNNVGVFGQLYNWIELNMFGGTAPLSVFIIWNIVLYEFIMDILFLFYMVFMFVVDFVESCIDKAFYKSHRGCE